MFSHQTHTLYLLPLIALLASGCASNTIRLSPPPGGRITFPASTSSYQIEEVRLSAEQAILPQAWNKKNFSTHFSKLAEARHPNVFKQSPSATPIEVHVVITQKIHQESALIVYIGSLCIVGGLLPSVPWETDWEVDLRIENLHTGAHQTTGLHANHRGWWSMLTPCGLLPVPGASDLPKKATVLGGGPGQIPAVYCQYIFENAIDRLALELAAPDHPGGIPASNPARAPSTGSSFLEPPPASASPF